MKQTSDRHHRLSTAVEQRVEDEGFLGALGRSRITVHPVRRIEQVAIGCIRALMVSAAGAAAGGCSDAVEGRSRPPFRPQPASASAAAVRKNSAHLAETDLEVLFTAISPIGGTIQRMPCSGETGRQGNSSEKWTESIFALFQPLEPGLGLRVNIFRRGPTVARPAFHRCLHG